MGLAFIVLCKGMAEKQITRSHAVRFLYIRDWSLITGGGGGAGGYKTGGGGMWSFTPTKRGGGGGNSFSHSEGGRAKGFGVVFTR